MFIKNKNNLIKNKLLYIKTVILGVLFFTGSYLNTNAQVLSGPSNPTIDSVPIFFSNKKVTSSLFIIDSSGNGSGLNDFSITGTFSADYSRLTNVVVENFYITSMKISTNQASTVTIDLSKSYSALSTNNNVSISGITGIDTTGTNFQSSAVFLTNSSDSAKTIAMHATFQNMNASEGNTLYNTNLGHLLVFYYPGLGTNFYFKSR